MNSMMHHVTNTGMMIIILSNPRARRRSRVLPVSTRNAAPVAKNNRLFCAPVGNTRQVKLPTIGVKLNQARNTDGEYSAFYLTNHDVRRYSSDPARNFAT
jgi:hypothetical protein